MFRFCKKALLICLALLGLASFRPDAEYVDSSCETTLSEISLPAETELQPVTYPPVEEIEPAWGDIWFYPISPSDVDLIALVTMAEAEGETELGRRLVIDTILNRVDDPHFPDTVYDVIYQPNQFSSMWDGRVDRCYVMDEIVALVKEELEARTNSECVFFRAGDYSIYGVPMFRECCHYFSSYE